MRRDALLVDAGIAVVIAALVLILAPGVAVVAILAIFVLAVCAISFAIDARRRRRSPRVRPRNGTPPTGSPRRPVRRP